MSVTSGTGSASLATTLPADPFTDLAVQFGMLLGVADFDALAANPRGKMRLHNAWLHGQGVVWGYPVSVDSTSRELRVGPGLALDAVGHELYLSVMSCLDLGAWFDTTSADPSAGLTVTTNEDGSVSFDAYLVVRFAACLAQPVPAMASPCDGSASDTAYSRVNETVELLLMPNQAPPARSPSPSCADCSACPRPGSPTRPCRTRWRPSPRCRKTSARRAGWTSSGPSWPPRSRRWHRPASPAARPARRCCFPWTSRPMSCSRSSPASRSRRRRAAPGPPRSPRSIRASAGATCRPPPSWNCWPRSAAAGQAGRDGHGRGRAPRIDPSTAAWDGDSVVVAASGTFLAGTLPAGTAVTSIDPAEPTSGWTELSYTPSFDAGTQHARVRAQTRRRRPACGSGFSSGERARRR